MPHRPYTDQPNTPSSHLSEPFIKTGLTQDWYALAKITPIYCQSEASSASIQGTSVLEGSLPKCLDGGRFGRPPTRFNQPIDAIWWQSVFNPLPISCQSCANQMAILCQSIPDLIPIRPSMWQSVLNPVPIWCQSKANPESIHANPVPIQPQLDVNPSNCEQIHRKSWANPSPIHCRSIANKMSIQQILCQSFAVPVPIWCQSQANPMPILSHPRPIYFEPVTTPIQRQSCANPLSIQFQYEANPMPIQIPSNANPVQTETNPSPSPLPSPLPPNSSTSHSPSPPGTSGWTPLSSSAMQELPWLREPVYEVSVRFCAAFTHVHSIAYPWLFQLCHCYPLCLSSTHLDSPEWCFRSLFSLSVCQPTLSSIKDRLHLVPAKISTIPSSTSSLMSRFAFFPLRRPPSIFFLLFVTLKGL